VSSIREQELEKTVQQLRQENELLRQKLDLILRKQFGPSSEKISGIQLDYLMNNLDELGKPKDDGSKKTEEETVVTKTKRPRGQRKKPRIPDHLPVGSREVIKPQDVLDHPEQWRCIGEEVSETLDFQPGHFFKRQIIRPKYVRIGSPDLPPIIAPLPNRWTERCIAAPGLQAHITISKYADHLPLYRQEQIFKIRHGVELPRNTMARWIDYVADSLKLIYLCMAEQLLSGDYLQIDETPIRYLQPGSGKAQQGYFWAYSNPKGDALFDWQTSRGHECLLEMFKDPNQSDESKPPIYIFQGHVQCDGYSAYKTLANKVTGIQLVGCWAHVRRKFNDALTHAPIQASWIIRQIQLLYHIEKKLREQRAGPRLRESVRASQSRPILARIKKAVMLYKARPSILPQSTLGKAVGYALGEWPYLEIYLGEGQVEIDNNLVENAIRPTALGKKNWMFIGRAHTGERSAIIYSLIESCRRRGIDPHEYLTDVLTRIPNSTTKDIKSLTPAGWAAAKVVTVAQVA
jgi:transposase